MTLVSTAVALFLASTGAFGTSEAPLPLRFGYWILAIGIGAAVGAIITSFASRRDWLEGPTWLVIAGLTLVISPPVTVAMWLLTSWIFYGGLLKLALLPQLLIPVAVVTLAATALNVLLGRGTPVITHAATLPAGGDVAPADRARFLDRLPPKLRGADLFAVQAEDHYLRLHTSRGSDLILFRLADALAELEGLEGAQTHRSWWVARDAVLDAKRGDGRGSLVLKGGAEAPVSRTYAPALREAGWF